MDHLLLPVKSLLAAPRVYLNFGIKAFLIVVHERVPDLSLLFGLVRVQGEPAARRDVDGEIVGRWAPGPKFLARQYLYFMLQVGGRRAAMFFTLRSNLTFHRRRHYATF